MIYGGYTLFIQQGNRIAGDLMSGLGEMLFLFAIISLFVGLGTLASKTDYSIFRKKTKKGTPAEGKKDQALFDELDRNYTIYNPDDVIMITKTADGKLMWLENGNESSGLRYILDKHSAEFRAQGIYDIPNFLKAILQTSPTNVGVDVDKPFADFMINGTCYRVVYRSSGYIESFHRVQ